jgi:alkylation response protein AidB-like acyl-CoA dehydrogenase
MDLMQTPEQDAIQQTVRSFLERELPMSRVREIGERGSSAGLAGVWRAAGDLGFFGLGVAESQGGAGYSLTEEMILFEELGRSLAPGPWLGTVIAAHALARSGGGEMEQALGRVLRGELLVGLIEREVVSSTAHPEIVEGCDLVLRQAQDERNAVRHGTLRGKCETVPDAAGANAFLVLDDARALLVPCDSGAVTVDPRESTDPTRPVARVSFLDAPCLTLAGDPAAVQALRREATALACAEAVGGITRTVEMSVEYAKVRQQFGRPIGSFQAVKHRCADMAVRAEMARSATIYATVAVRDGTDDLDFQTAVAKLLCANAYIDNAADNVQNHGGMGFTWECDAHLYVKRARSFDQTLGSRRLQLDALVRQFREARMG